MVNTKRHKIVIMWARACIILHNLIIRIEGDDFDEGWREYIRRAGLTHNEAARAGGDADAEDGPDTLERARRRAETPGQRFRVKLMEDLLDSPSCSAERRP